MKRYKYNRLVAEMIANGENQLSLSKFLGIRDSTLRNKFAGRKEWTISEIEKLCSHYKMNYYDLFKVNEAWDISQFKGGVCGIDDLKE